jgi:hypothetical protein
MIDFDYYRNKIKTGDSDDPSLSVYMVRDSLEVEQAGLDELAWTLSREHCSREDALAFFDMLEKAAIA